MSFSASSDCPALYSFGAILADRCGLSSVVLMLVRVLGVGYSTIRSRLQEFYQPASAKSGTRRRETRRHHLLRSPHRLGLEGMAVEPTGLGPGCHQFGRPLHSPVDQYPLSRQRVPRGLEDHASQRPVPLETRVNPLLRLVQPLVPAGWTVIVMTDRGLYARWLFQEVVALGWHPLMRINRLSKFRKNRSRSSVPVTALVPKPGQRWKGRGVAFPKKPCRRLDCTLFACWEVGHEEPWFILTDLEPDQSEGLWYAMRAWIEHGFKLLKSQGWQWQKSRMTDPDRAGRLWLVLAVATRYVLAVGGEADASDADDQTRPLPPFASETRRAVEQVAGRPTKEQSRNKFPIS